MRLRLVAPTGASYNKVSLYDYSAGKSFYTKFSILLGGSDGGNVSLGTIYFFQGDGSVFSDANGFSRGTTFTGLRFQFGASGAITTNYVYGSLNNTWAALGSTPIAQGNVYVVEVFGNNTTSTINYTYNGSSFSVAAYKQDIYINSLLIGDDLAKSGLSNDVNVDSWMCYGESSTGNVANIFLDDITYSNSIAASYTTNLNYFSKSTGTVNTVSNFTTNDDGTGSINPSNFSTGYITFNIKNNDTPTIDADWTVSGTNSKIVIGDGTNACAFTAPYNVVTQDLEIKTNGSFTLNSDKNLTVNGSLTNSAGASGLVIESGGSLLHNTNDVAATVKREIAKDNKWHFISSPVSGQNICDGIFAPTAGNFNESYGQTYDFFKWSEPAVTGDLNWINLKNSDWSLNTTDFGGTPQFVSKLGYLVEYKDGYSGSTTKSFAGNLGNGDQSVSLTSGGNTWNLIGNPFPSAINWGSIDKGNLADNFCYIYNPAKSGGAGYEAQDNGYISPMQGFFVSASGSSLSLPNSARAHGGSWMKNSTSDPVNQVSLQLSNIANFDETVIRLNPNGTTAKGRNDAFKLFSLTSEVPQVYSLKNDDVKVCINTLPYAGEPLAVPLGMYIPANGNYSLTLSGLASFSSVPGILLEDLKTQTTQNMVQNPVYNFSAATSDNDSRFVLHFSGPIGINEKPGKQSFFVFASDNALFVLDNTGKNQGNVQVYNMMGQMIAAGNMNGSSTLKLNLDVPVGYYIVKVVSAETTQSSKVLL